MKRNFKWYLFTFIGILVFTGLASACSPVAQPTTAAPTPTRLVLPTNTPGPTLAPDELLQAGVQSVQAGNLNTAIEQFQAAIDAEPNNADAYQRLGSALYNRGDFEAARTALEKSVELNPKDESTRLVLAALLNDMGEYAAAVSNLQTLLERNPDNPEAHFILGLAYQSQGDLPTAAAEYTR